MPADPQRVRELFAAALGFTDLDEREAFLDRECCGDDQLRQELEQLLQGQTLIELAPLSEGTAPRAQGVPDLAIGSAFAGRYRVLAKLGEGGMGSVYVADQTEPVARRVALKIVKPEALSSQVLARFEQERQALALMDHPNIAKVLDAGVADGTPYFVMELIKGVPITRYCDKAKLTPRQRLGLFVDVCQAVQHAHQKGVIHRDLKPSNILVGLYDGKPIPKVIDFGVAKATGAKLGDHSVCTEVGQIVGTLEYMSPEQAEMSNLDIDTRSDVFTLGVVLYELLTGTVPFSRKELQAAGYAEMLRIIKEVEPPRPSTRLSHSGSLPSVAACRQTEPAKLTKLLRGDLDWVVMKALEKDRSRRYQTVNGLATDVQRYLADEPVVAGPPGAAYRLKKFVKRNQAQAAAAGLVLLALLGGMVGATWGYLRAEQSRRDAEAARDAEAEQRAEAEAQRDKALAAQQRAAEQQRRAESNEKKAEEEKRVAQAVRDFLQTKLLGQADPRTQADALLARGGAAAAADRDVTVRQLLDRAAAELSPEKIEENFSNQPLLQAELLHTVGHTYRGVGELGLAVALLQRSAALYRRHLPADHPAALTAFHNLALAYQAAGRVPEAIRLYEQVKEAFAKRLGADHPDTLVVMNNLARAYQADGKVREAIRLYEQVREAQERKLGADHPNTLATLNGLASAYRADGKLPEAIRLFEQVKEAREKKLGADHPFTLGTLNNLAGAYRAAGKLPEAIRLYEQVKEAQERKLGPDHPHTLTTLNNLATAYWRASQLDRSIPLFESVLKRQEARLGRDHPSTLMTIANLGVNYRDAGRLGEALSLLKEARSKGKAHASLAWVEGALITTCIKAGEAGEATRLIRDRLAGARKRLPADSPQLADQLATAGSWLVELRLYAEAEPPLRECLALRERLAEKQRAQPWQAANARSLLGAALLGQRKHAEAEPLLLAGYGGLKQGEKAMSPQGRDNLTQALRRIVELYEATGNKDEAARWRKELDAAKANAGPISKR